MTMTTINKMIMSNFTRRIDMKVVTPIQLYIPAHQIAECLQKNDFAKKYNRTNKSSCNEKIVPREHRPGRKIYLL